MAEEWRDIPGYEGLYEASSEGRVRSWIKDSRPPQEPYIKAIHYDHQGYARTHLYKNSKHKNAKVARIVLMAFAGIPDVGMEASHVDGDRRNDNISNLKWETRLENERRKTQHGTRPCGGAVSGAKVTEEQVLLIREMRRKGKGKRVKIMDIAKQFNLSKAGVDKIISREHWKHI